MTRINALRNIAGTGCSTVFGSNVLTATWGNINALIFAAVLIVCSVTVGCSKDQPKPVSTNIQIPAPQMQAPAAVPAPTMQAENKPAPKKVVHRKPATVNYTDKTYGLTFEYPRRYAIETGDAAAELLLSHPVPMNFVQTGGVALAAVELPETGYLNTDFSSAFFNVSVNKTLTADQCAEFAVPEPKTMKVAETNVASTATPSKQDSAPTAESAKLDSTKSELKPDSQPSSAQQPATSSEQPAAMTKASVSDSNSKLMVGDLELRGTEAVSGEGTRQSDSKYFHVFQNGSCYEFALNVTTVASEEGIGKHVDRDKVFDRLQKILATVKINPVTPEVTAEAPATPAVTPAQ